MESDRLKEGRRCGDIWLAKLSGPGPLTGPGLELDGLETDNASTCATGPLVKQKVFNYPKHQDNSLPNKNKKKKKKKKSVKNDSSEKIPSPNSSLDQSYNEATQKSIDFVKCLGFTEEEVKVACSQLNRNEITQDSLLDMAYKVKDELISLSSMSISSSSSNSCSSGFHSSLEDNRQSLQTDGPSPRKLQTDGYFSEGGEADEEEDESLSDSEDISSDEERERNYRKAVEKEKMRYRDMIDELTITCRLCNCSRATILLLPCGHLASCEDCLMDVRRCPIARCNKVNEQPRDIVQGHCVI